MWSLEAGVQAQTGGGYQAMCDIKLGNIRDYHVVLGGRGIQRVGC
jgi:hypothetical protein